MKQSWLARNLVMNFVIIFALLFTEIFDIELIPSMIIAYFLSEIINGLLFKVVVFVHKGHQPILTEFSLEHLVYAALSSSVIGLIVSQIVLLLISFKIHEGQAIVFTVLMANVGLAYMDHSVAKAAK